MACALTQGYSLDCRDNAGGVKAIYIAELAAVSGVTSALGVISAIAKAGGKRFWKYNQAKGVSEAFEDLQGSEENGTSFVKQTVNLSMTKMQAALRNEIVLLAANHMVAVVQDRNDKYWYYGQTNGLIVETGKAGTGKALGDKNGYDLSLTGEEPVFAMEVSSSVITGLETP